MYKRKSKPATDTTNYNCRLQRDRGLGALHLHGEAAGQVQDTGQALALLRAETGHAALLRGEPVLARGGLEIISQPESVVSKNIE